MTKVLGLDLGTNSIGWAVVEKDEQKIWDAGVRIFPEGVEAKTIGQGDKEKSQNATRREKRQMRRQFYRKRLRKIKLLETLIEQGMCPLEMSELKKWKNWDKQEKTEGRKFPTSVEFSEWIQMNPYELRDRAIVEKLTLHELGRVFYHLIQRRGFLSSRKGEEDPKTLFEKGKPDENILPVNATKNSIKDKTLGAYLYTLQPKEKQPYQTIIDEGGNEVRVRGRYTTRDMYIAEFEKIWQVQSRFHDLNIREVRSKRIREVKGNLNKVRTQRMLTYLKDKYGEANIETASKDNRHKLISYENLPLKIFLGGEIEEIGENGETKLKFSSNESVLFWQRPLRSQKGLLSNCRFEDNVPVITKSGDYKRNNEGKIQTRSKKPCPLSHPEFELFRSYQFINNIRYGKNTPLTPEQKLIVLNMLNGKDGKFDFATIPKKLKLTYEKFNYDDGFKVLGNSTIKLLRSLFDTKIWDENYEEIWHCFYFYEDNDKLVEKLQKDYAYSKDKELIKKIKLKEGYGNVSLKAIRNILPYLEKGIQYDKAVVLGGVKNAFGKRWDCFKSFHQQIENDVLSILREKNKEGEAIQKVKEYLASPMNDFGFTKDDAYFSYLYHHSMEIEKKDTLESVLPEVENLRNPIVQQGLNEMRRLVNALLQKYRKQYGEDFYFDQIHVEMGRDLRSSKEQRREMTFRIRENEEKNQMARERLAEYGLQPSRQNVQKYLMFHEIEQKVGKATCPYTGKTISVNDLLGSDNAIQIEHIVPFSVSLDDSFGNKTLCEANFNRMKGEKTPYEFHTENPDAKLWGAKSWEDIEVRAFRLLPFHKARRFTSKKKMETSDFIERQLNDSRYIAKKSAELLSQICKDVRVLPGQLTAELRHLWGLNNILQPVQKLSSLPFDVDYGSAVPYYLVLDEKGEVVNLQRKRNAKPKTQTNEILVSGLISKKKFESKNVQISIDEVELSDGKYWARVNVEDEIKLIPKFIARPKSDEESIVFRGKIEKGYYKHDTAGNIKTNEADGDYWAKLNVTDKKFEEPQKDKQPKVSKNQILLFGSVQNGLFKCYIYQCKTNLSDGKYWILLSVDKDNVEFIRAENPKPEFSSDQLLITATIDDSGELVADIDKDFIRNTDKPAGKYYAVLNIQSLPGEFHAMENGEPSFAKGERIVEGDVWVDKYTGEIKFDPKKNREDHRHHAIDAITVALTERGNLQRLSTYNAQRKEKMRGKLDSTEHYPEPWDHFSKQVQEIVNGIFISHKKEKNTLTKNRKGFSVRGQLHKENVFGKPKNRPDSEKVFHRRTKITELKNNKHVVKVVDVTIRKLIETHLRDNCNVNVSNPKGYTIPPDAFVKEGEWRLFLPNKHGEKVPIKKIRIRESIGNAVQLKSDINQYVNPRNNHHVVIYKDAEGSIREDVVTFWTVVERRLQGLPVYSMPKDAVELITTLEINDMFLLGLSDEEYEDNKHNKQFLSKYLYRVQKLSSMFYTFRYHLASSLINKEEELYIQSFGAWQKMNPIKFTTNELGEVL